MRAAILAFAAVAGFSAIAGSTQAAPVAPHGPSVIARAITLVGAVCGPGFHRVKWQDRWGNWHRACVPNR